MRRSVRLFSFAFLITLPPGCSDSAVIEPEGLFLAPEAQFSTQPTRGFAFSDYLPLVPGLYGIKTYATGDGPITSQIVGPETAPYQPPITGVKMTLGDESWVIRKQGKAMWWLQVGDYVFSRSCGAFSPYPESMVIGTAYDGMILDRTGGERLWLVNVSDPADCEEVNTGEGDSYVALIQVQDVRLPDRHVGDNWPPHKDFDFKWHTYRNAILVWELEPNRPEPFMLDFDGLDELLGIQLPTAEDVNDWAIDDLTIWGRNVGLLLLGDIELGTGKFAVDWHLVSETHAPNG
jgi:hypothetical protein